MSASFWQILVLGLVQGAAELLPVSSSAHVIIAEKLLGLDPSTPEMTFLLVCFTRNDVCGDRLFLEILARQLF
jgi:undecaprenyl pyrophosphate phosphatase UppP